MHPREYISYSQLMCWEKNPNEYIRLYFHDGKKRGINRGVALGKELADALESGEDTGDFSKDMVIAQMPKYEIRDKEIKCQMSSGHGKYRKFVPILIKPDSTKKDYSGFYEYKQGAGPWTQEMVDKDDQMTFYFTGLYLLTKARGGTKIPEGELIWAPTEKRIDSDGIERPYLTGEIKKFKTTRSFADILRMQVRISRAWEEIGQAFEKQII